MTDGLGTLNLLGQKKKVDQYGLPILQTTDTTKDEDVSKINQVNLDSLKKDNIDNDGNSTGIVGSIFGAFKPGEGGHSTGGNILKGLSDVTNVASGLGQLYFTKKNMDLQKEQQDYLRNREAMSDDRMRRLAQNAGNGASY